MFMRTKGFVRPLTMAFLCLTASVASAHVGEHLFSDAPAKIVTLKPADYKAEMQRLINAGYDIAGVDPAEGTIDVVVGEKEFDSLENSKSGDNIIDVKVIDPKRAPDAKYTTHEELTAILNTYAQNYPDILKLESAGKSIEGRDLWVVKISENVKRHDASKPTVFFNAMHHAREVMTTEVAIDIIETLAKGYSENERIKNWVSRNEIWILPMVNPDGNNKVWTANNMWRKNTLNGYGVDINRNYPYQWGACNGSSGSTSSDSYRGPSAGSEPETKAMMNFVARIKPVTSISYHSYSELVLYPASCQGQHTDNHELIDGVGKQLASRLPKDSGSGTYSPGTSWEILYAVDGGDIDWYYQEHDVIPYVIEVNSSSQGFQPAFTWRQRTVEKMRAGWGFLLDRLDQSGIRGQITNAKGRPLTSGQVVVEPIAAPMSVTGQAIHTWRVKPDGSFHVMTQPGMYRVKVTSGGKSWEQDVTVGGTRTDLEITMN